MVAFTNRQLLLIATGLGAVTVLTGFILFFATLGDRGDVSALGGRIGQLESTVANLDQQNRELVRRANEIGASRATDLREQQELQRLALELAGELDRHVKLVDQVRSRLLSTASADGQVPPDLRLDLASMHSSVTALRQLEQRLRARASQAPGGGSSGP